MKKGAGFPAPTFGFWLLNAHRQLFESRLFTALDLGFKTGRKSVVFETNFVLLADSHSPGFGQF